MTVEVLNGAKLPTYPLTQKIPTRGQRVMLTARDHLGPYYLPFACEFDGESFINPNTRRRLTIPVIAWRPLHIVDRSRPYKPSRLMFTSSRSQVAR